MGWGQQWAPYVSVGEKLNKATKKAAALAKKQKREPSPVEIQGRTIAKTFWSKAWSDNVSAYQDYSHRLPSGATYVRNGSVVDLVISPKKIEAIVAGSNPYTVKIEITALDSKRWRAIRSECSESIDSLLDLLSGKLSDGVMKRLTDQKTGLFPAPREIKMSCSCPDYSSCCKHLAAVLYGIGERLDSQPELLFLLRGVDHEELVSQAIAAGNLDRELSLSGGGGLDSSDLGTIFGIELDSIAGEAAKPAKKKRTPKAAAPPETAAMSTVLQISKSRTVKAAGSKTAATKSPARSTSKSSGSKATVKSSKKKTGTVKKTAKRSSRS